MSNHEPPRLADGEYRFACLVWDNEPLPSGQLVALAADALGWKKSTTYTVLKKLCDRGLFRNDGGTVEYCAVLYRYIVWKELAPEETGEEYLTGTTLDLFPNNFTRRAHAPGYPE